MGGGTDRGKDSSHFGGSFITEIWVVINHELHVGERDRDHNRNQRMLDGTDTPLGETCLW